eukprot:363417-Chlamydomonas_euryale.AAC.3
MLGLGSQPVFFKPDLVTQVWTCGCDRHPFPVCDFLLIVFTLPLACVAPPHFSICAARSSTLHVSRLHTSPSALPAAAPCMCRASTLLHLRCLRQHLACAAPPHFSICAACGSTLHVSRLHTSPSALPAAGQATQ